MVAAILDNHFLHEHHVASFGLLLKFYVGNVGESVGSRVDEEVK